LESFQEKTFVLNRKFRCFETMVKVALTSMTMAIATADDVTSLLQVSAGVRQSKGQQILSAVAEGGKDTICVAAGVGDVAPVPGSFTTKTSQQAVEVEAGSVAAEDGSFCVPRQEVLLMQRTFALNTARDFEAALGRKQQQTTTTTTTTVPSAAFDFEGDLSKRVVVDHRSGKCEDAMRSDPVDKLDATVADKQKQKCGSSCQAQRAALKRGLDSDQMRVCECRNFMKTNVLKLWNNKLFDILKEKQAQATILKLAPRLPKDLQEAIRKPQSAALLQRNLDTALAAKKQAETTTTTTTSRSIDLSGGASVHCTECVQLPGFQTNFDGKYADRKRNPDGSSSDPKFNSPQQCCTAKTKAMTQGCTAASQLAASQLDSWTMVAKLLNDPDILPLYELANITDGWQHCDKSWVVGGACDGYVDKVEIAAKQHEDLKKRCTYRVSGTAPKRDPNDDVNCMNILEPVRWSQESKADRERLVAQELDSPGNPGGSVSMAEDGAAWNQQVDNGRQVVCGTKRDGTPRRAKDGDCTSPQ